MFYIWFENYEHDPPEQGIVFDSANPRRTLNYIEACIQARALNQQYGNTATFCLIGNSRIVREYFNGLTN